MATWLVLEVPEVWRPGTVSPGRRSLRPGPCRKLGRRVSVAASELAREEPETWASLVPLLAMRRSRCQRVEAEAEFRRGAGE